MKFGDTEFERFFDEEEDFEIRETALSELGQNWIHRYEERFV